MLSTNTIINIDIMDEGALSAHYESVDGSSLAERLVLQLAEVEMLKSMYPSSQEFYIEDPTSVQTIQTFVDGSLPQEYLHCRIGCVFRLEIQQENVEVVCRLSHEYPNVYPHIFTRFPSSIPRDSQRAFTDNLHQYIQSLTLGDICLSLIIHWIKENLEEFEFHNRRDLSAKHDKKSTSSSSDLTFVRLWIYSHHIFSKFKRRDIVDIAQHLKLSGFSIPGKPGLICVEGAKDDVDDFWSNIRSMQWKKLAIKDREEMTVTSCAKLNRCRKFTEFEEKAFDIRGGKGREYHMDLGKVFTFLENVGCGHIFALYFGVEGRNSHKLEND